ncbi:MAG: KpsF/GutQ family sugar-phosphate isomerase [Robiginitomaculum sp.]|nr:MAG: KpsF/GutQ family sugar-phosphate isomerase [Robiginitomaculum sp.]
MQYIDTALDTLKLEQRGLEALVADMENTRPGKLGHAFIRAIELIKQAPGRIIVTGMGKSGHIGRKIASTLASTGTPASFVHPGEASHGDLGMIGAQDIVLALSNSGETRELADILQYCGRFNVPLIAITSGENSALAKAADLVLLLPNAPEACGQTRAPTTSTTMTLALGDALAVVLLRDKGFGDADFKNFHPGGKLGAALKKVSDVMTSCDKLPLCAPDMPIYDAVKIISEANFGCVGVLKDGSLVGVITDGDLRRNITDGFEGKRVLDIMTHNPVYITPGALAVDAIAKMSKYNIQALFVCEDTRPIGILHIHDFLDLGIV